MKIVFFNTVVCNVIIYDLSGLCINRRDQIRVLIRWLFFFFEKESALKVMYRLPEYLYCTKNGLE